MWLVFSFVFKRVQQWKWKRSSSIERFSLSRRLDGERLVIFSLRELWVLDGTERNGMFIFFGSSAVYSAADISVSDANWERCGAETSRLFNHSKFNFAHIWQTNKQIDGQSNIAVALWRFFCERIVGVMLGPRIDLFRCRIPRTSGKLIADFFRWTMARWLPFTLWNMKLLAPLLELLNREETPRIAPLIFSQCSLLDSENWTLNIRY